MEWLTSIAQEIAEDGPLVRITVVRADGSTPRETGAAMYVSATRTSDTIGGGALELGAISHARRLLHKFGDVAPAWQRDVRDFALGPSLGQCCGGHTRLLFEVFTMRERRALGALTDDIDANRTLLVRSLESGAPLQAVSDRKAAGDYPLPVIRVVRDMLSGTRAREAVLVRALKGQPAWFVEPVARPTVALFIYGAGHIGRALVRVLADLPFTVTWIDTAPSRFPEPLPDHARAKVSTDPAAMAAKAPAGAFHIVMTYSHSLDLAICLALLRRGDFGFLGLIGSETKRARFVKRLSEAGIADAMLGRLTCPIGIPGLTGKEPGTIAVSVAAQLLQRAGEAFKTVAGLAGTGEDGTP